MNLLSFLTVITIVMKVKTIVNMKQHFIPQQSHFATYVVIIFLFICFFLPDHVKKTEG